MWETGVRSLFWGTQPAGLTPGCVFVGSPECAGKASLGRSFLSCRLLLCEAPPNHQPRDLERRPVILSLCEERQMTCSSVLVCLGRVSSAVVHEQGSVLSDAVLRVEITLTRDLRELL